MGAETVGANASVDQGRQLVNALEIPTDGLPAWDVHLRLRKSLVDRIAESQDPLNRWDDTSNALQSLLRVAVESCRSDDDRFIDYPIECCTAFIPHPVRSVPNAHTILASLVPEVASLLLRIHQHVRVSTEKSCEPGGSALRFPDTPDIRERLGWSVECSDTRRASLKLFYAVPHVSRLSTVARWQSASLGFAI